MAADARRPEPERPEKPSFGSCCAELKDAMTATSSSP